MSSDKLGLGVSGLSADPRVLLAAEGRDNAVGKRARAALALCVRSIVREVGGLVAVLSGLDLLVFTAGIGEHSVAIRARVCQALGCFDIELDAGCWSQRCEHNNNFHRHQPGACRR